jgi:hypothetical protein
MNETIVLKGDNVKIINEKGIYTIEFKFSSYSLINSLIKTRIIQSGSTDGTYKTIIFKAQSVKTLDEYQNEHMKSQGKKNMLISNLAKMIRTLSTQLHYLIKQESSTIIGYNKSDIIVINDEKFAFLGSELVSTIDSGMTTISSPFSTKDFFVSPELLKIKELPSKISFKTAYFSLGLLFVYMLLADDEFYIDYLNHKNPKIILELLNNNPVKNTRIYWLLSRCLLEQPKDRSILLI